MRRSALPCCLALAITLAGCGLTEPAASRSGAAPDTPQPPLGALVSVSTGAPLVRAEAANASLRLDLEVRFDPALTTGQAPTTLAVQLRTPVDGALVAQALAEPALVPGDLTRVAATLEPTLDTPQASLLLDLFLVAADASPRAPLAPRSPILRGNLELGRSDGALSRLYTLDARAHHAILCEDGRVVVGTDRGVSILEPDRATPPGHIALPPNAPALEHLVVDWRCSRAFGAAGERFVVFDLLDRELDFDEPVPGLLDVVFDVNPRYVMLLLADGTLRRYFLRDGTWSDYSGRLPAAPLRDAHGELVMDRDGDRLLIATEGPALCVVVDTLKLVPRCLPLDAEPAAVALLPYGFADEPFAPFDPLRAEQTFEDDLEAREVPTDAATALGAALVATAGGALEVRSLDASVVVARHALDLSPVLAFVPGEHGQLIALAPHDAQALEPLDRGALPARPLLQPPPSPASHARLWPSPDLRRVAWLSPRGLEVATDTGEPLAFVAGLAHDATIAWSTDGHLLVALAGRHVAVVRPAGVEHFVAGDATNDSAR